MTAHLTDLTSETQRGLVIRPRIDQGAMNLEEMPVEEIKTIFKLIDQFERLLKSDSTTLKQIENLIEVITVFLETDRKIQLSKICRHDLKNVISIASGGTQLLIQSYGSETLFKSIVPLDGDCSTLIQFITTAPQKMQVLAKLHTQIARSLEWKKFLSSDEYHYLTTKKDISVTVAELDKLIITQIELPVGFLFLVLNELIENSAQIAQERKISFNYSNISIHLSISSSGELVIEFCDKSGGFDDLNMAPGQTQRKGGTGKGLKFVHQMIVKAAGGKILKENIFENNKRVGAKITLLIPLWANYENRLVAK